MLLTTVSWADPANVTILVTDGCRPFEAVVEELMQELLFRVLGEAHGK